jgi:hypothetical protein
MYNESMKGGMKENGSKENMESRNNGEQVRNVKCSAS